MQIATILLNMFPVYFAYSQPIIMEISWSPTNSWLWYNAKTMLHALIQSSAREANKSVVRVKNADTQFSNSLQTHTNLERPTRTCFSTVVSRLQGRLSTSIHHLPCSEGARGNLHCQDPFQKVQEFGRKLFVL